MYIMDYEELQNIIIEKRKGLAYKIWRLATLTRSPFVKDFPDTPEKACPELYPPKPRIKMEQWMIDKYYNRKEK